MFYADSAKAEEGTEGLRSWLGEEKKIQTYLLSHETLTVPENKETRTSSCRAVYWAGHLGGPFSTAWVIVEEEQEMFSWSLEVCDPSWVPLARFQKLRTHSGEERGLRASLCL